MKRKKLDLHRSVQYRIAEIIGKDQVKIEHPFPGHFADVYWPEKKIVFEVQCTPIPLREVLKRINDYEKLGLDVVWILHNQSFNKRGLSLTELFLRTRNAYYTDIYPNLTGGIYDQLEVIAFQKRFFRSKRSEVDLSNPYSLSFRSKFFRRFKINALWFFGRMPIAFKGDRAEFSFKEKISYLRKKSLLEPLYLKFAHKETSLILFTFVCLRLAHFLFHLGQNRRHNALKNRNKLKYRSRLRT